MKGKQGGDGQPEPEAAEIRLNLPAEIRFLNVLGAMVTALVERIPRIPQPEQLAFDVGLAAHEVCTNIMQHAYAEYPGRVEITFTLAPAPRRLIIEFQDTGRVFDLNSVREPDLDQAQIHGYGLFLVRALVDELDYIPAAGNNRWLLVKYLTNGEDNRQ